ncbi:MAG: sugar phosphate isomerase/epimerase family protein [Saprospiraceae bacterium]
MKRRTFVRNSALAGIAMSALGLSYCTQPTSKESSETEDETSDSKLFFKMSLAQWSLNQSIREGGMDPMTFAKEASDLGFEGIEYVSQLYKPVYEKAATEEEGVAQLAKDLKKLAAENNVQSLLIMIDGEGDLSILDEAERLKGVENHHKWVKAAAEMGCHSIRVNLFGDGTKEEQFAASVDSLNRLGTFAKDYNINVLVENHGGYSSDPDWLVGVMQEVNMSNVGTLPDFGNFCLKREGGERWGAPCIEEYPDKVEAVKKMMPYAKAVSAKTYAFNEKGEQDTIDYYKMIAMIRETGYNGFIGVEYEDGGDEKAGIIATKELLIKAANA